MLAARRCYGSPLLHSHAGVLPRGRGGCARASGSRRHSRAPPCGEGKMLHRQKPRDPGKIPRDPSAQPAEGHPGALPHVGRARPNRGGVARPPASASPLTESRELGRRPRDPRRRQDRGSPRSQPRAARSGPALRHPRMPGTRKESAREGDMRPRQPETEVRARRPAGSEPRPTCEPGGGFRAQNSTGAILSTSSRVVELRRRVPAADLAATAVRWGDLGPAPA